MSEENVDQTNSTSTDRGADRSDRGEAQELSHGKRDRSREMLREELERNLDYATRRSGRPRDWEPEGRPAREAKSATDKAKDRDQSTSADGAAAPGAGAAAAIDTTSAPKSWRADEKHHYDRLPAEIKNAVHRREQEMQQGVDQLKSQYSDLDRAKTVAERIAAKEKRQREEAQRARRAGASLGMTSPGSNNTIGAKKRVGGKSVRASIEEALEEASGR